ncbi:MAG TPA: DUF1254 domain-containing protein [Solirubrobacterales bacterium]|nr:DUF1254 domain-containing protein [Solirubrobacterales bacterium]
MVYVSPLNARAASRLGADAFVFGFPLLLMAAMRQGADSEEGDGNGSAPNRFVHLPHFPGPGFRTLVGANSHSLYSLAWMDLTGEPLLLRLPDTGGRSYLMPLFDAWSNNFASLGPRTSDSANGVYAIVGPSWDGEVPAAVARLDAPTGHVWAISHLHAGSRDDLEAGRAIQRNLQLTPLSEYETAPVPTPAEAVDGPTASEASPHRYVMTMRADEFLGRLAAEMGLNPPAAADGPLLDRLAEIGLRAGEPFAWGELPGEVQEALEDGLRQGREEVEAPPASQVENGWQSMREGVGTYGTDYLRRAQIANVALGAVHPRDAIFPFTEVDHEGDRLNGAHRYVLRFEPGELPPVGALWSLALYDMDQLPVDNPLDRYALGDRDELELGADGSLEIAIQHDRPPGSDANWLPAPEGDFNLMLHMYWPKRRALSGEWTIPPVTRIG